MRKPKQIYGTPITQENFWAYAVTNGKVVLVRCESEQEAVEEQERMRNSDAKTIGHTRVRVTEMDMWTRCRARGWKLSCIRNV